MNRLKYLREEMGWTQEYLGSLLNVKNAAISKYETGRAALTEDTIRKLSELFNVSSDYLLGIDEYRSNNRSNTLNDNTPSSLNENILILTDEDRKVIQYYHRLINENKEYIIGQMVGLFKEQQRNQLNIENVSDKSLYSNTIDPEILKELNNYRNDLLNEQNKGKNKKEAK